MLQSQTKIKQDTYASKGFPRLNVFFLTLLVYTLVYMIIIGPSEVRATSGAT
jgi:hypothetical protein